MVSHDSVVKSEMRFVDKEINENKMPIDPNDRGNGTVVHVTAIFGFMLAGLVIQDAVPCQSPPR